jgi:peptidoglycan/xylan/chitin deacetylase (PgdA/CDA1 family)
MITLWDNDQHWQELLNQEGISYRSGPQLSGRDVVILNRKTDGLPVQQIWKHIQSGGALLTAGVDAAAVWPELWPEPGRLQWIAAAGESPLFRNVGIVDIATRGSLLTEASVGITDSGAKAIVAAPAGEGFCILLPFNVTTVLNRVASTPKRFPADMPRLPFDTVARTSRGEVRRLVANCLRFLLARKGLPYVHLASVAGRLSPIADRQPLSAFAFRVDTDFGPRADLEAVARLAERVDMKFSCYVNVGAHKAHLDLFADLARQGHDIQLHCNRHIVYSDYKRNLDNFKRGRDTMAAAGISPVGVVAPFGQWNPNLNRALERLGFEYSSEFCLAYDDLPFRPVVNGCPGKVLQVPVHPICLGRLVAARASEKQMAAYFHSVIDLQVARQEPCFLYDHPERIAQFSDVLADVLEYGKERCGAVTTLTEFARWWQRREKFAWSARMSGTEIEIQAKASSDDLAILVEQDDRYAVLPAGPGRHSLGELEWHALPEPVRFDPRSLAARKPSLLFRARSLRRRMHVKPK